MPVFVSSRKANGLKTGKKRAARLPKIGPDIRHGTGRTIAPLYLLTGCRHPAILSYCYTDGQAAKSRSIRAKNTTYLPPIRKKPNKTRKGSGLTVRNLYGKGITGCAIFPRPVKNCQQVDSCAGHPARHEPTGRTFAGHPTRHRPHGKRNRTRRTSGRTTRRTDERERHGRRTWTAQAARLRGCRRSGRTERGTGRTFALVELSA